MIHLSQLSENCHNNPNHSKHSTHTHGPIRMQRTINIMFNSILVLFVCALFLQQKLFSVVIVVRSFRMCRPSPALCVVAYWYCWRTITTEYYQITSSVYLQRILFSLSLSRRSQTVFVVLDLVPTLFHNSCSAIPHNTTIVTGGTRTIVARMWHKMLVLCHHHERNVLISYFSLEYCVCCHRTPPHRTAQANILFIITFSHLSFVVGVCKLYVFLCGKLLSRAS